MNITRVNRARQRGSTLVETALTILLLLVMTIGTFEFGRAVWCYNTLPFAVRQGARYAIVNGRTTPSPTTASEVAEKVSDNAVGLDSSALNVTTTWLPDNKPGSAVRVRATYNFSFAAPFYVPATMTFSSTSQMIILR